MKRILEAKIKADLEHKIVLLSGPRQAGKTTLAKALYPDTRMINCNADKRGMIKEILVRNYALKD